MFNIFNDQGNANQDLTWQQFYTQLAKSLNLIIPVSERTWITHTVGKSIISATTLESSLLLPPKLNIQQF